MKRIILDTNALMAISQFGLDLFSEVSRICDFQYSIHVLEGTVKELESIFQNQKGKHREAAGLAIKIIKARRISILKSPSGCPVDDYLLGLSKRGDIVLTQDADLKRRLKRPYITMRKKKYLVLIG